MPDGILERAPGLPQVATLEGHVAELSLQGGLGDRIGGNGKSLLELERRLCVITPQSEHVSQALCHPHLDSGIGFRHRSLCHPVVGFGDVQGVLTAGVLCGGQGVGQPLSGSTGGVEVVGQLEDSVGVGRLDMLRRQQMQSGPFCDGEAVQQGFTKFVVGELAATSGFVHPDHSSAPGLIQGGNGSARDLAGQFHRQQEVEVLSQHRTDGKQLQRIGGQLLQPLHQEERSSPRGLDVGESDLVDPPSGWRLLGLDEGAAFDQAQEHLRGHERAPLGQLSHRRDNPFGKRARHRLGHVADLGKCQCLQGKDRLGRDSAERVIRAHLLRTEGGNHQDMASRPTGFVLPFAEQLEGYAICPLAVVQQDQSRTATGSQAVQQG